MKEILGLAWKVVKNVVRLRLEKIMQGILLKLCIFLAVLAVLLILIIVLV